MKIFIDRSGLLIPSNENSRFVALYIRKNGEVVDKIITRLCKKEDAEKIFYIDMTSYTGEELEISVEENDSPYAKDREGDMALSYELLEREITAGEPIPDGKTEARLRPRVHFTSRSGWINDPNGLCFYGGLYHLFFQYTPGSTSAVWDNQHWGHAVSSDLLHWQEKEAAVRFPEAPSGSAFVCRDSGELYIAWKNHICKTEDGIRFSPVHELEREGGCDPKMFFHEESGRYAVVDLCYDGDKKRYEDFLFSVSDGLKSWTVTDRLEGWFECPELVKLKIEGTDTYKWVLYGGDMAYMIGEFDGERFIPDPIDDRRPDPYRPVTERGRETPYRAKYTGQWGMKLSDDLWQSGAYACQVFNETEGGRTLRLGWYFADYAKEGAVFNQCMILPQEIILKATLFGLRLCARPAEEITNIRGEEIKLNNGENAELLQGKAWDIDAIIHQNGKISVGEFSFEHMGDRLLVRQGNGKFFDVPMAEGVECLDLRMITDSGCFEVFAANGAFYMPLRPSSFPSAVTVTLSGAAQNRASIFPLEI